MTLLKTAKYLLIIFCLFLAVESRAADCGWVKGKLSANNKSCAAISQTRINFDKTGEGCKNDQTIITIPIGQEQSYAKICCCSELKSETVVSSVPRDFIFPGLQIPFPNLRLTPTSSLISKINSDGSYFLSVPWIAEYISAAYNYGVGIVGILAAVVLMAGGLLWLLSRGDASKTSTAKELIVSSLIGLIIMLTSYMLLSFINPELLKLKSIELGSIKAAEFPGDYSDSSISATATALNPYAAGCHSDCQSIANKNIIPGDLVIPENKYLLEISKGDRNKVNKDSYEKYKKGIDCINKKDGKSGDVVKYKINNSWRSAQVQIDFKKPNNKYEVNPSNAASPCCSNHGSGIAIDINPDVYDSGDIKCFKDNGLLRNKDVGGSEAWHFSPTGK